MRAIGLRGRLKDVSCTGAIQIDITFTFTSTDNLTRTTERQNI